MQELHENLANLFFDIKSEVDLYDDYISSRLVSKTQEFHKVLQMQPQAIKLQWGKQLKTLIDMKKKYVTVWLYSVILELTYDKNDMKEFMTYVLNEPEFRANTRYFLYYQFKSFMFRQVHFDDEETKYLRWKLLEQSIGQFREQVQEVLTPIPECEKNQNLVFVITEQILNEENGPSKIAFDRCKILMEKMNKQILLINTAEVLPMRGEIPVFIVRYGNYSTKFKNAETINWKGREIPYFQCEDNMPDVPTIRELLQFVQQMKPGMVIAIGGSSVVINLVNEIMPVLTVGLTPSDIETTMTDYQTVSRPLDDTDKSLLKRMGKSEDSVIVGIFTSSLKESAKVVTRAELGIPEDAFVLTVVGYRLKEDFSQAFADMLKRVVRPGIIVALIGKFDGYEAFMQRNPELKDYVKLLGMTDDILAWVKVCDLYVNPHRRGGGTSGVEAIYLGVPVVTLAYGDVATNVGSDFCVDSYEEMPEVILRYWQDTEFYQMMSEKGKERAKILLDTEGEFVKIVEEFERRKRNLLPEA